MTINTNNDDKNIPADTEACYETLARPGGDLLGGKGGRSTRDFDLRRYISVTNNG